MKFVVTIMVTVDAVTSEAALNLVEDAINGYKEADLEIEESDVAEL